MNKEIVRCVICGKEIPNPHGFNLVGNDPSPVYEDGRCCDICNHEVVLPTRVFINSRIKAVTEER